MYNQGNPNAVFAETALSRVARSAFGETKRFYTTANDQFVLATRTALRVTPFVLTARQRRSGL